MRTDFPQSHEVDQAAFARDKARPRAKTSYVIFFTPRAGSTWLTDVATQTGALGRPGESFNPRHLNKMARAMNASNLGDYCDMIARKRATNGVAGFEITHHQLRAVFRKHSRFLAHYPDPHVFWLIRKDIVAQAVSLYKMTATRVSHSTRLSPEEIAGREADFTYNADRIAHWINHILLAEQRTEALILEAGWRPMRLNYEDNIDMGARALLNHMAAFMGLPPVAQSFEPASGHHKIATGKNAAFAARFASERAEDVRQLAEQRAPYLNLLKPYDTQVRDAHAAAA